MWTPRVASPASVLHQHGQPTTAGSRVWAEVYAVYLSSVHCFSGPNVYDINILSYTYWENQYLRSYTVLTDIYIHIK